MIDLRDAKVGDAARLVLRPEDAAEVSPGWQERTEAEIAAGRALAAWDGDELVALCGIAPSEDLASPWLLASPRISRHRRLLAKTARHLVADLRTYPCTVGNYIGKASASNRKFIQKLGFVILPSPSGDHDFFYLPKSHV